MLTLTLLLTLNADPVTDSYVELVLRTCLEAQTKKAQPCACAAGEPCVCQDCHCPDTYARKRRQALEQSKPLVVFVNCEQRPITDSLACYVATFPGVQSGVVVSRPSGGRLLWLATLPADATAEEIRAACRPPVSAALIPPAPAFRPAPALFRAGGC
jgi:hypothetical protein